MIQTATSSNVHSTVEANNYEEATPPTLQKHTAKRLANIIFEQLSAVLVPPRESWTLHSISNSRRL